MYLLKLLFQAGFYNTAKHLHEKQKMEKDEKTKSPGLALPPLDFFLLSVSDKRRLRNVCALSSSSAVAAPVEGIVLLSNNNKLLKHPGVGFKMMLPQELHRDVERENREFHERARLDKQNVIPAFQWTGESLYDLARARMLACAKEGSSPEPKDLFDEEVSYERMLSAFQSLRVPRHLFRFLYRVLVDHCNRHTDAAPVYRIRGETFESVLAVYNRDIDAAS